MRSFLRSALFLALIMAPTARSAQPSIWRIGTPSIPFQDHETERRAGSIAGRITVSGRAAPGVTVMLLKLDSSSSRRTPVAKVRTDEEGRYLFKGVSPGSYDVYPAAPALVLPKQGRYGQRGKTVMAEVGEAIEGVDFALTEGGVITGRVTDADGRPVVEETITLNETAGRGVQFIPQNYESLITDDRGMYRVYGLPAGRYLVSVGTAYGVTRTRGNRREYYKETFHPGVTDRARAVPVEVKEGAETTGGDIITGRPQKTYAITGRVVNAENRPLPGIQLGVVAESEDGNSGSNTSGGWSSDEKGVFRIEGALPGHYLIYPRNDLSSNSFGEPISLDVKNFAIEKLVEGDYELLIGPMGVTVTRDAGVKTMSRIPEVKQTVSVNARAVSEVTLVLPLKP